MFLNSMCEMVRGQNKRVVYPEGREERAIRAAGLLRDEKLALPTLLGDPDEISKRAKAFNVNLDGIDVHDYLNAPQMDTFVETYFDLRMHKGISLEFARERMSLPHFFGAMMVRMGAVDGMVSGLNSETKPFIPAFEIIKLKPGFKRASSLFVLEWPERLLFFADCSVNIDPDAQTLCDIAEATAQTVRTFGYEPRIAFLSFSTRDSAKGASVEKVKEATRLARTECPSGTVIDGEIQFDAALLPEVAQKKAPDSPFVEQPANVFIFPDLNCGNIAYKICERLARATATGPILQGLNHPINDVSRGCSYVDFANVAVLTAALSIMHRPEQVR